MARLLKRGVLFLLITVILYLLAMFVLGNTYLNGSTLIYRTSDYYKESGGTAWRSFREFDRQKHWDALVVGSSHAYFGYDPYVFEDRGHSCYILGSSAQSLLNSHFIIKDLLDSTNTGLLVLDVYEGTFITAGLESTADLIRNYPDMDPIWGMAWSLHDPRVLNLLAQRITTPYAEPTHLGPHYMGLGFTPKVDSVDKPLLPDTAETLVIDPRQVHFFKEVVDLCAQRGIPLVVSSHYGRKGRNPARHAAFKACIDSVLAGTGIPYLDYTESSGVSDLDNFVDNNHLNLSGARIFTGHLVDSLESLGYLSRR